MNTYLWRFVWGKDFKHIKAKPIRGRSVAIVPIDAYLDIAVKTLR